MYSLAVPNVDTQNHFTSEVYPDTLLFSTQMLQDWSVQQQVD